MGKIGNNRITIPDGCSVRQVGNVIYFEPKEEEEIKRWEDLVDGIEGYYINLDSSIYKSYLCETESENKSIARTEAHCRAMLAMAMISQLKPYYGGDITKEDWADSFKAKYLIYYNDYTRDFTVTEPECPMSMVNPLVSFYTYEQAQRFIENNQDLLNDYFMINKNK